MLTKLEQDKAEAVCLCLPMIAESLASIAKSFERTAEALEKMEACDGDNTQKSRAD